MFRFNDDDDWYTLRRPASATSCRRELGLTWAADAIDTMSPTTSIQSPCLVNCHSKSPITAAWEESSFREFLIFLFLKGFRSEGGSLVELLCQILVCFLLRQISSLSLSRNYITFFFFFAGLNFFEMLYSFFFFWSCEILSIFFLKLWNSVLWR